MTDTMQTEYVLATDAPIAVDVAADIGNARAVILVRVAGETVPIVTELPAVRSLHGAFSWELFASRGLPAASWGSLRSDEHVIERDGVERYLGRLAIERSAAASSGRGSDARYHDGTILEFILAGIAAALPTAARVTARLTTMLPIDLWHLAPRVAQALAGTYRFAYNGRAVVVRIADVAVRREGEAAFAQLSGDTSGRVLIMDIGGRTVNLALFAGGEYRHGKTLELGVEAALDNVDRALLGQGARALSLAERGELLTALLQAESYHITAGHRAVRVDQIARQAKLQLGGLREFE